MVAIGNPSTSPSDITEDIAVTAYTWTKAKAATAGSVETHWLYGRDCELLDFTPHCFQGLAVASNCTLRTEFGKFKYSNQTIGETTNGL